MPCPAFEQSFRFRFGIFARYGDMNLQGPIGGEIERLLGFQFTEFQNRVFAVLDKRDPFVISSELPDYCKTQVGRPPIAHGNGFMDQETDMFNFHCLIHSRPFAYLFPRLDGGI
jgi:hypothetical protein